MTIKEFLQKVAKLTSEMLLSSGYQELHVHTDASWRDGASSVKECFATAKKLGRKAIAITDHGNMARLFTAFKERTKYEKLALEEALTNANVDEKIIKKILKTIGPTESITKPSDKLIPFIEEYGEIFLTAIENSILFVPGVEAYICPNADYKGYYHMVFYAIDEIGLKELFKLTNLGELTPYKGRGRATYDNIKRLFGEGTMGHGHVIATSACIQGPIACALLKPQNIDDEIQKQNRKLAGLPPVDFESIASFEELIDKRNEELKSKKLTKTEAGKAQKKSFTTKFDRIHKKITTISSTISSLSDATDEKSLGKLEVAKKSLAEAQETLVALEKEKAENDILASTYDGLCKEIDELIIAVKQAKESLSALKKQAEPHQRIIQRIEDLNREKELLGDVYSEAKVVAEMFDELFGRNNFYIELQNHGIPKELYVLPLLKKIANETGIPMTVANDVHYPTANDSRKRSAVVAIRLGKSLSDIEAEVGNDQLYFKSNEQMAKLFADVPDALLNPAKIANRCSVVISHNWHLPTYNTGSAETPNEYLKRVATENIPHKFPLFDTMTDEWKLEFNKRLEYELNVIENMGFSSYIAIVHDYIRYGRSIGGRASVGPGRGSAAGSLVCYLVDITDVDPLRYNLLFERFLNPARVSMPDIDVDFAAFIREEVVAYVTQLYAYKEEYCIPEINHTVCNIMTEGVFAARSSVRNIGRVTGVPLDFCDRIAKMIPNKPKMTIRKAFDENPDFKTVYENEPEAKKLIDDAMLIEGMPSHTGVHAAGVIIADKPITEYAPMFWNEKKGVWVIQYDMVSCESDIRLLKMDVRLVR